MVSAAGDSLRFLPGQVAVLGVVVWLGAGMRYLKNGRPVWALLLVVAFTTRRKLCLPAKFSFWFSAWAIHAVVRLFMF